MTDREMLELAAKAAELYVEFDEHGAWITERGSAIAIWNPITNDDDALRLAVKLRIWLEVQVVGCMATDCYLIDAYEPYGDDPLAATRRAIVRAAAEIGKAMP